MSETLENERQSIEFFSQTILLYLRYESLSNLLNIFKNRLLNSLILHFI